MTVRARGTKFQADFMHKRKRFRAEFPTYEEAAAWEAQQRANVLLGKPVDDQSKGRSGPAPSTIGGLVSWVADTHWRKKKSAVYLIRNAELFAEFVGPNVSAASALSTEKVAEYCKDMAARARCERTIDRHRSAISVLARYAAARNMITTKPVLAWGPKVEGRRRYFEEWEVEKITSTLRHWGKEDDARFYEFLLDTGARLSEALKLKWTDVLTNHVILADRKSGRTSTIPMTPRLKANLLALKQGPRGADPGPFAVVTKGGQTHTWRQLQEHLPFLADAVPHHSFRHTTCSWLVQRGVDLFRVKEFMDHQSIQTTMGYAHLAPKHMEDVVKMLGASAAKVIVDEIEEAAE